MLFHNCKCTDTSSTTHILFFFSIIEADPFSYVIYNFGEKNLNHCLGNKHLQSFKVHGHLDSLLQTSQMWQIKIQCQTKDLLNLSPVLGTKYENMKYCICKIGSLPSLLFPCFKQY